MLPRLASAARAAWRRPLRAVARLAAALVVACASAGAPTIAYDGSESCDYCRMTVEDRRFGAALVTRTGKTHRFDSIECLAAYAAQPAVAGTIRGAWVSDFRAPGTLVPVERARFVRAERLRSPMGRGLVAVSPASGPVDDATLARTLPGDRLDWAGVLALVQREGAVPHAHGAVP